MVDTNKTRQSPYSLSAEKAVLGCLLINKEAKKQFIELYIH